MHDGPHLTGEGARNTGTDVLQEDRCIGGGKGPRSGQRIADVFMTAQGPVKISCAQAKPRSGRLARRAVENRADAVQIKGNAHLAVQALPSF